ncbi:stalk domain-containing protein [Vallitalea okinawensis]|uniref:stalk domain-containing protein n=1 Tax=Vallitalea okinawensis TaxID=2078660 RepID=UPI000CFCAB5D|nr:CAP-associated domain-containing protein [Vallitalea okinawensis]
MMYKKVVSFLVVSVMALGLIGEPIQSEAKELKLYSDGKKVCFSEDLGFPFIDNNGRTQIPFRAFSEAFGSEVTWDGDARVAYAVKDNITIAIPVGKNYISRNGHKIDSDTENSIINDRVHVPLRIVMESFNCNVDWDSNNWAIYVTQDGSEVSKPSEDQKGTDIECDWQPAPTEDKEQPTSTEGEEDTVPTENKEDEKEPVAVSKEALRGIHIGDDVTQLVDNLGQPHRTDASDYGFKWYIYNNDYSHYLQVGVKDNKVIALYTNASYWKLADGVEYGASAQTVKQNLGAEYYGSQLQATSNNINYTFLVDQLDGNKVTSVLIMDSSVTSSHYYGNGSEELRISYEKEIFDLTNVERVNKGLQPYTWEDDVTVIAREHSKDMSDNSYFSHTNLQGQAPWDRAKQAGINYSYYGENIAMGQKNAIYVINGWMNSSGHRKSILSSDYTGLGVGVWFANDDQPYYTQNFIK